MKPVFSTRIDDQNPVHTRITVFNRGGNSGTLVVNTSDASELIARIEEQANEIQPYNYGDKFDGDWERYALCPQCGREWEAGCKCREAHRICPDCHSWHVNIDGVIARGTCGEQE